MRVLGLDLGTTHVKAVVADADGRVLGRGAVAISLDTGPGGLAEQDLGEIWRATGQAIREALSSSGTREVVSLGVSSQGGALQCLDAERRPVGRVVSWLDGRGAVWDDRNTERFGRGWFAERVGHGSSGLAIGQIQRLRASRNAADSFSGSVGFVGDLVVEGLCGVPAHDATSAAITLLFNPRLGTYDPEVLTLVGLDPAQLPPIRPADEPAGSLLTSVAEALGLFPGIPVSVAVHDQYAAALGCGAVEPGQVMLGTGTAWVLVAMTDGWQLPVVDDAFVAPHVVPGVVGQLLSLRNGGSAVRWATQLIGIGGTPDDLDARVQRVRPGCDGLRCAPWLAASTPAGLTPGTGGRLVGLRLEHGPDHVLRAVIEGLAFEVARHLQFLRDAGLAAQELLMTGGAAASRVTPQIVADVTGLPVHALADGEASLRGAVILGSQLVASDVPWGRLIQRQRLERRVFRPGPDHSLYPSAAVEFAGLQSPEMGGTGPHKTTPDNA